MKKLYNNLTMEFNVIFFILKLTNEYSKAFLPLTILLALISSFLTIYNLLMSRKIIDELILGKQFNKLLEIIILLIGVNLLMHIIRSIIFRWLQAKNQFIKKRFNLEINKKTMSMDYEYVENPKILDAKERALSGINQSGGINTFTNNIRNIITCICTIMGLLYILNDLSIVIILILIIMIIFNYIAESKRQKAEYHSWQKNAKNNKMFSYLDGEVIKDYKASKYIRLYDSSEMILSRYRQFDKKSQRLFRLISSSNKKHYLIINILDYSQKFIIYFTLALKVISEPSKFTIGSFTMYTSALYNLISSITKMFKSAVKIKYTCKYLKLYKEFIELPPILCKNNEHIPANTNYSFEFSNVSFAYPGMNKLVLKNINLKIPSKQKLAIVGLNGAGKTTFIKLVMRLYDPKNGEILLNDNNIKKYNYREYQNLFGVVFQDSNILSFTVKENICLENSSSTQNDIVIECLKNAGVGDKIDVLENGADTYVDRIFDDKGIEFSGGEMQKIAIARAIYKNASIMIFDEPTASLDPLAEYEIFNTLHELTYGKTAVFISHRLSSTRICDCIAVFHNGEIIQYGSHDELMKDREGKYYKMFMAQAQYYVSNDEVSCI
ncbi:ABC transporter ATP-binding protein [Vallitalea guaymasensis]|uniref:ABC transporter ATP-binding protein n=1 Tax=Vallitalea guaymasensis TaxID=1185412 RepID=A0A8J8SDK8_9FIRM|nr:ABC transporter ATP-binding protein [Vallitalea guaymasensis]QUH30581.1 ABC transporter ATP-binding protein [Vallitalea guaymasensis]